MVKEFANRETGELLTEAEIREKGLNKGEFSETHKGEVYVFDSENSEIAKKMNLPKKGKFAIKIK